MSVGLLLPFPRQHISFTALTNWYNVPRKARVVDSRCMVQVQFPMALLVCGCDVLACVSMASQTAQIVGSAAVRCAAVRTAVYIVQQAVCRTDHTAVLLQTRG